MRKLLFVAGLLFLLPLGAWAQDKPKVEIFGGYSYLRLDHEAGLNELDLHGWNASVTGNVNKWLGFKTDVSGHYNEGNLPGGLKEDRSLYLILGGPQFTHRKNDVWQPFAHVLIGAARFHQSVRTATGRFSNSDTNFAFVTGVGLDAHIAKNLAVRLFQADYVLIRDSDIDESFHNFRVSTGLVLRLGDH